MLKEEGLNHFVNFGDGVFEVCDRMNAVITGEAVQQCFWMGFVCP
jgi:hypothetical protein